MKKLFGKEKTGRALLIYSILFLIISAFIYHFFKIQEKSLISSVDAVGQHYATLIQWRNMLINFIKTGDTNTFTWHIGSGLDLFANYAYYTMGDFINYLSVFFPLNKMETFYQGAIFARLFFVGFNFIIYSKYKKHSNFSSIIGSLLYTFCIFALFGGFRHIYFSNALAIFPLLMMGMDKIVLENKKAFYIFIIFITYVSSFYFAYMMSVCIFIYGSILIISKYKEYKLAGIFKEYIKVFLCSILGITLAAFILLPTFYLFLNSSRGGGTIFDYVYDYSYYVSLVYSLISYSSSHWVMIGIHSIVLISLPIAIRDFKKNYKLLLFLIILFIPLFFSPIGSIFSCLSYPNNRWTYVISFILSYLTVEVIDNHPNINKKDIKYIIGFCSIYFLLLFLFVGNLNEFSVFSCFIAIFTLFLFENKQNIEKLFQRSKNKYKINSFNIVFLTFIVLTTIMRSYIYIYRSGRGDNFIADNSINTLYKTNNYNNAKFAEAIDLIKSTDEDFYKIGKTSSNTHNDALLLNYNTHAYYYSIIPSKLASIGYDLSNATYNTSIEIRQFDYRTKITSLLGMKYFISASETYAPYGYIPLYELSNTTKVYQNNYPVSAMQFYNSYITLDEYEALSNIEKESAILKVVALDDETKYNALHHEKEIKNILSDSYDSIPFSISNDSKKITVTSISGSDANNKLNIDINENEFYGELYLKIDNINYEPFTKDELYELMVPTKKVSVRQFNQTYKGYIPFNDMKISVSYKDIRKNKEFLDQRTSPYNRGDNNLLVNLGQYDNIDGRITITLSALGIYTFDNIEVVAVNFKDYEEDITNLNRSHFEMIDYNNGYMTGTVDVESDGIIQIMTSYVDGWEIYIDGEKVEPLNVNKYFLGTYIKKGIHTIEIKYHTQFLREGIIISSIGLGIFIIIIILELKAKKDENTRKVRKRKTTKK